MSADEKRKKRFRRTANAIERRFTCWCGKAYGSEGSLNQHKKNKEHFNEPEGGVENMEIDSAVADLPQRSQPEPVRPPSPVMNQPPTRGHAPPQPVPHSQKANMPQMYPGHHPQQVSMH